MRASSVVVALVASLAPASGFNSYLDQMGGGSAATMKKSTFAPSGKPSAGTSGGYLDIIGAAVAPPILAPPPPPPPAPAAVADAASTAPSAGDYLSSLPVQAAPTGGGVPGYLDALLTASAPSGGGMPGYLDALPRSSAPSGSGVPGYLDAIAPGSGSTPKASSVTSSKPAFVSSGSADGGSSNAVLDAINNMTNNMNRNQQATISVLKDISVGVKGLVEKAEAKLAGVQPWQ